MAQGSSRKEDSPGTGTAGAAGAALGVDEGKGEAPPTKIGENGNGRPVEATYATYLILITGAIALALSIYWMFWGGSLLGGIIVLLLGIAYVYGGRALHRGESWGWGAGVFAGVFVVLFGVFLLPYAAILIVLAIVIIVLLLRVREYFGMVRPDPAEEERARKELEAQRTSNPEGLHCPHCGSTALWVAKDGSAFCQNCRAGTISLKPPT